MGYEIVRYRPEFKEGVLELLELLWSPSRAVNAACFEWKYERNPYQSEPLLYLALDRGRVVGMRGMCGARWEAGVPRRAFAIPSACDLVIAPDHRNRGVISEIMRFGFDDLKKRGTEYVFNLSAGPVTFVNSLAMGWRSIGPLQAASRKTDRETGAERWKRLLGRWPPALNFARAVKNLLIRRSTRSLAATTSADAEAPFRRLDRNFRRTMGQQNGPVHLEDSARSQQMTDLIEKIGSDGRIRHVRNQEYLAWRYRYPLYAYRFLFWEQSRLEGYLVLEARVHSTDGIPSAIRISDWEATSPQVFDDLVGAAIRLGEFEEMDAWMRALPRSGGKVLEDLGFRLPNAAEGKRQYLPTVLVRATGEAREPAEWRLGGEPLLDGSRWDTRSVYAL